MKSQVAHKRSSTMIKVRAKQTYEFDDSLTTVDSVDEAKTLRDAVNASHFKGDKKLIDAANGANESFFVTTLRAASKRDLNSSIASLKAVFGEDYAALNRALSRVKAFRGKNAAWKNHKA